MHGSPLIRFVIIAGLAALWSPASAQSGPEVPCQGCPFFEHPPYPETGIWRNPHQSGTGFMLEFQNGHMGGFYYLYDADGDPIWYLVAGELELVAIPGIMGPGVHRWEVEAELERLEGGACLGCPYEPPVAAEPAGTVQFEFEQRNFARFRIDGGEPQSLLTLTHGVSGSAAFAPETEYVIPDLDGFWSITRQTSRTFYSEAVQIEPLESIDDGVMESTFYTPPEDIPIPNPPPTVVATLRCGILGDTPGLICEITFEDQDDSVYLMPLGNLGDARFRAEAENGDTVTGHRLNYD